MNNDQRLEVFQQALYGKEKNQVFAVLDGASIPTLQQLFIEHKVDNICLYRGELEPDLAEMAPYLAHLPPESSFTRLLLQKGWGSHLGIFAISKCDLRTMRMHFRKFLMVLDPEGKPLYFRYYDPRVLRVYLPTCNTDELQTVFGPVEAYIVESETPNKLLRFTYGADGLGKHEIALPQNNVPE
jgi:hypothetical protein